jgi:hypothetical protein
MKSEEIKQLLDGDSQAATFMEDNFEDIQFVGTGAFSRVFRAKSKRFHHRQEDFAVRVVLGTGSLREDDI